MFCFVFCLVVPQFGCTIIRLADFFIIGHLFSSKFFDITNKATIDDLEHKSYKAVF
jgi:hypothetical protein